MRLGVVTTGMSGPGSGSWNLLAARLEHIIDAGIDVFIQGSQDQIDRLHGIPIAGVSPIQNVSRLRRLVRQRRDVERFAKTFDLDVVQLEAPPFVRCEGRSVLAVVHDVRFLERPMSYGFSPEKVYQLLFLRRAVAQVQGILTLSDASQAAIVRHLGLEPDRVHIAPPVTGVASPPVPFHMRGGFALVLGHLESRKNIETVIRASCDEAWPADLDLVVAGRDAGSRKALETIARDSRCQVTFPGAVDEATKAELLERSKMVLIPSLLEGFGIVALEAAVAGTPFLASDREPLTTLARTDQAIVPALDSREWAGRVAAVHQDPQLWKQLVEAQQATATLCAPSMVIPDLLETYERVIKANDRFCL